MSIFSDTFPTLHTARLNLTEITPGQAPELFRLFTDSRVTEYYNVVPLQEEKDIVPVIHRFHQRYKDKTAIRWGISLKNSPELIGTAGYNSYIRGHRGVIVYELAHEWWNKGLASEAIREVIQYGFHELALDRIEAEVMPGNAASEKVLEKNGFRFEGLLRHWMQWDSKFLDINMWSILKQDVV
ncbi:MAG TPA: GNAT family protein [Chitinophaga sp.]|uniref:GNAT family N-acetyltransferase n=1 Tax=Chitinophaga sp. TaxID=1869181 RepID=UPI002BAFCED6|nr:GNAT family protein [Chitinophaga sp.]HVI43265.1 GNAT family protein [Chitinophaga sp.]